MTRDGKYLLLCAAFGALWGAMVSWIAFDMAPRAIWGGLIASPAIGFLIGASTKRWRGLPTFLRIVTALVSLYFATALFGLGVGLCDWMTGDVSNRIPYAVVLQSVLAFLWGLTFLGWFVLFWPLAYLNYRLSGEFRSHAPSAASSPGAGGRD